MEQIAKQYNELVNKYEFDMHSLYVDGARYEKIHQDIKNTLNLIKNLY